MRIMGKKFSSFFISFFILGLASIILCGAAFAAQPVLDKPAAPELHTGKNSMDETVLIVSFPVPQSIRAFLAQSEKQPGAPKLLIEFDTRMDGEKWFLDRVAGGSRERPLQEELLEQFKYRFLVYAPGADFKKRTQYESEFEAFMFGYKSWDLSKNFYSFRYRYVYEQRLPGNKGPVWEDRTSLWSDEATAGKTP